MVMMMQTKSLARAFRRVSCGAWLLRVSAVALVLGFWGSCGGGGGGGGGGSAADAPLRSAIQFAAQGFDASETLEAGEVVGTLTAQLDSPDDAEADDPGTPDEGVVVRIRFATEDDLFRIEPSTGEVSLVEGGRLDFEAAAEHGFAVTASAPGSDAPAVTAQVTVTVTNVFEYRLINRTPAEFPAPEGTTAGVVIGTLAVELVPTGTAAGTSVDGAAGTPRFTAPESAPFVVDESSGAISLADGQQLNYEQRSRYDFDATVRAEDAEDMIIKVQILVINAAEVISFSAHQSFEVPEDAIAGQLVGTLEASSSSGVAITFTPHGDIPPAGDGAAFVVEEDGDIVVGADTQFDHENLPPEHPYEFEVRAQAEGAVDATATVRVSVSNVLENVIIPPEDSALSLPEGAEAGAVAGTLSLRSQDGSTVTLHSEDTRFAVDEASGDVTLRLGTTLDYETKNEYTLEVIASAADAPDQTLAVKLQITDIELGLADDPYTVGSLAELQSIATGFQNARLAAPLSVADSLAAHYLQRADIDATATAESTYDSARGDAAGTAGSLSADAGKGFLPIGSCKERSACTPGDDDSSEDNPFRGGFDGAGYRIVNLHIARGDEEGVGLFGFVLGGSVQRVVLAGGTVVGDTEVGALIGVREGGVVAQIESSMSLSQTDKRSVKDVGGLIGYNRGDVEAARSSGEVRVGSVQMYYVGGLIGHHAGGHGARQ